ncbi:hypothetical protein GCM10008938_51160 [Deinococcus roseus]|uniref:HMA domain-containing protein n=1 Tax=Deinococcus roseus TaxID=392414 RepID=A0ABQ2DL03_9DEIO|nr:hypothetical protein GCM10008938_51160 [Deinococcus roseus]
MLSFEKDEVAANKYDLLGTMMMDQKTVYQLQGTLDCTQQGNACNLQFKATSATYVYEVRGEVTDQQVLDAQMTGYSLQPPTDIVQTYRLRAAKQ